MKRIRIREEMELNQNYLTSQTLAIIAKNGDCHKNCTKQKTKYLTIYNELWNDT